MRVAINGFGRIGRSVFRILNRQGDHSLVAINDLAPKDALVYLLKYDTVMGRLKDPIRLEGDSLITSRHRIRLLSIPRPEEIPWKELGVDVVVEATGIFRSREKLEPHLRAGASRVILTVPAKDKIDYTVVIGVNDGGLREEHRIISNASCTTNCLAPVAKVLHEAFGIEYGIINTIHAYTNDQRLADVPHTDWRRSRAAAENIIPTETGAARAVGLVIPELKGKLDGLAMRVPVPDGSVVDFVVRLKVNVSADEINGAIREAAGSPEMSRVLEYSEGAIVSTDIIGNPHSCTFDAPFTKVIDGSLVKTLSWYDNEWGYSNRVVDLIGKLADGHKASGS